MSREEIKNEIINAAKPVYFDLDDLKFSFGFKRVNGQEFLLRKFLNPKMTEDQMSYVSPSQLHQNIEIWCKENGIKYTFDFNKSGYLFIKL